MSPARMSLICILTIFLAACDSQTRTQWEDIPESSRTDIYLESNGVRLAATVSIPSGEGPFPGVVLVHGSGSSDRSNPWTRAYENALVERGIAVIHPDKRGSGESQGEWQSASFDLLAADAIAALDSLESLPQVDSSRSGLIGFSQGSHIVPIAALESDKVDFAISISGSVVPIFEQIGDELRLMAERNGLSADAIRDVAVLHDRAMAWIRGTGDWSDYENALRAAQEGPYGDSEVISGFPESIDDQAWSFLRAVDNDGPLDEWESLSIPVAFIYGGEDENVDVSKSVRQIQSALQPLGVDYVVMISGRNGHALFREDVLDFLARWMSEIG